MHFFSYILTNKIDSRFQYLLSISLICLVSAICFLFSAYIGPEAVAFILLLTLSFIAMFFDILPVLLSAILSALTWDFFFLLPRFNFRVGNTEDKIMLSMYFIIAMINAALTYKIRQSEKRARKKETKAQTLKLYNTVLNSLSHEFRTPIATIIAATDNMLASPSKLSGNDTKNLLSEISTASLRLNRQVENLLNMSRLESGFIQPKKEWCNVNELVYDVIGQLDDQLNDHIIRVDIPETLPLFKLDHGLMEHALYNLVCNAAKYTPAQSLITISAGYAYEKLLVTVEDNGPGLPADEVEKVFEKFYRLKNAATGGTGLGLSIVKGFVEAHQGTVSLSGVSPTGARFTLKIPAENILPNSSGQ